MPPCPRPPFEKLRLHERLPAHHISHLSIDPLSHLVNLLAMPATLTTRTPSCSISTPTLTSLASSTLSSTIFPVLKATIIWLTLTKSQPVTYSKKPSSWSSKCTSKNQSINYAKKINSTNSPMSPLTSRFKSSRLIYGDHLNMASQGLEPKTHLSSSTMDLMRLDRALIPFLSTTSLPYHLPTLSISSTSDLEDAINSELVSMEIYELYG